MLNDLYTTAGENLNTAPWQVYPRPQMRRDSFLNLNGTWELTPATKEALPQAYHYEIFVPFCPESLLSGVHQHFPDEGLLFYRKHFTLPEGFRKSRVLLHFGAVDQIAEVFVNGQLMGHHEGGYESFCLDITPALAQENELVVRVRDNLKDQVFPYGKQTLTRGGMWYTPVSGIWQTVWLESVPENYIQHLDIQVDTQKAEITVTPKLNGKVLCEGTEYPLCDGKAVITPQNPRLWTPETPELYDFTVITEEDRVDSYFALRSLEIQKVDGIPRLCLNGKPYFFHGLLDQGYWSDGLFLPATPEGFTRDILAMKELGFNMLRKHIKVEPEQFYYDCDRLGMVVFQDMVNNGDYSFFRDTALPTVGLQKLNDKNLHKDKKTRQRFLEGMEATVKQLKNHPCICYWTIFNEGWGQFDSDAVYHRLRQLDDSRFIDSTSGWFRRSNSDVESLHIYFGSWKKLRSEEKPLVLSEFGGYCYAEEGHLFNPEKAYGYKACKTRDDFNRDLLALYRDKILPAMEKGLCAAVYTQVSDVEDEITGLLTYDRKVCKVDKDAFLAISKELKL
ncbi:MAG: glycoside hydrolase family 2 [Oscillospiraceae bacterium]|nr:glycoside hydrolase family 2 [Oscillospiraceae bacterium]